MVALAVAILAALLLAVGRAAYLRGVAAGRVQERWEGLAPPPAVNCRCVLAPKPSTEAEREALREEWRKRYEDGPRFAWSAPGEPIGRLWQHGETGRTYFQRPGDPEPGPSNEWRPFA